MLINKYKFSSLFLHFVLVIQIRYTRTPVHTFVVLVPHMTNFVLFIDTPWLYFAFLVHTYCMFASLFLVILVPTCFRFKKPKPDICGEDFFLNT